MLVMLEIMMIIVDVVNRCFLSVLPLKPIGNVQIDRWVSMTVNILIMLIKKLNSMFKFMEV